MATLESNSLLKHQINCLPHKFIAWMRGLVCKEIVVLHQHGVEMNVRFINRVDSLLRLSITYGL